MRFLTLIWAGLWRKKARAIQTLLSKVTAFFLFGMPPGLERGNETLSRDLLTTSRLHVINRVNQLGMMPMAHVTHIAALPGVAWACIVGLMGGLFPAIRAARLPVAAALRDI